MRRPASTGDTGPLQPHQGMPNVGARAAAKNTVNRGVPFRAILETLLHTHAPAVRAAIFCDHEGEKVAAEPGDLEPFDVDILGASLAQAAQRMRLGTRTRILLGDYAIWVVVVDLGCYLVVVCAPGQDLACRRDLSGIAEALVAHM